jgi:hypothetical protein
MLFDQTVNRFTAIWMVLTTVLETGEAEELVEIRQCKRTKTSEYR